MNKNVFIFEGYDGAGKSTLIKGFIESLGNKTCRIVGRKSEPTLKGISSAIEDSVNALENRVEVFLRAALEIERLNLVKHSQKKFDFVVLDRGVISARSWVDYYNLNHSDYSKMFKIVERALEGATIIFCRCSFEKCWRRIKDKNEKSKKELLGKTTNSLWYQ